MKRSSIKRALSMPPEATTDAVPSPAPETGRRRLEPLHVRRPDGYGENSGAPYYLCRVRPTPAQPPRDYRPHPSYANGGGNFSRGRPKSSGIGIVVGLYD